LLIRIEHVSPCFKSVHHNGTLGAVHLPPPCRRIGAASDVLAWSSPAESHVYDMQ